MKKTQQSDWFRAGFDLLESVGFGKITIDNLCRELHVTKGSFYHHFGNIDGYIEALMQHWLETNTQALIAASAVPADPMQRISKLQEMVMNRSHKAEKVIRGWGFANSTVGGYIARVDRLRLAYSQALMRGAGLDEEEAAAQALLEYACLIGIQQLQPDLSAAEMEKLYGRFRQNIVPATAHTADTSTEE